MSTAWGASKLYSENVLSTYAKFAVEILLVMGFMFASRCRGCGWYSVAAVFPRSFNKKCWSQPIICTPFVCVLKPKESSHDGVTVGCVVTGVWSFPLPWNHLPIKYTSPCTFLGWKTLTCHRPAYVPHPRPCCVIGISPEVASMCITARAFVGHWNALL